MPQPPLIGGRQGSVRLIRDKLGYGTVKCMERHRIPDPSPDHQSRHLKKAVPRTPPPMRARTGPVRLSMHFILVALGSASSYSKQGGAAHHARHQAAANLR